MKAFFKLMTSVLAIMSLVLCLAVSNLSIVMAAENTQDPVLKISVSSEVTLEEDDIFTVTLKNSQGQTASLDLKAIECYAEPKPFTFGEGTYEVSDLVYKGNNQDITNGYYGIKKTFSMSKGNEVKLIIMVGPVQITTMDMSSMLIKKAGNIVEKIDINEVNQEEETPTATTITEQETTGVAHPEAATATEEGESSTSAESNSSADESSTTAEGSIDSSDEKKDPDEDDVIEKVEDKKDTKKKKKKSMKSLLLKGFPILLIAIGGIVAVFIIARRRNAL